jgi:5'-nucleotidase
MFLVIVLAFPASAQVDTVTILHFNDSHSNLATIGPRDASLSGSLGGIARVATLVGMTKMEDPNALVLHAGDVSMGDLVYTKYFSVPEFQLLLNLGFDAVTLGNHEFDLGPGYLAQMLDSSFAPGALPVLSANTIMTDPQLQGLKKFVSPYTIKQSGATKVGIFGLTTPSTNLISNPSPVVIDTNFVQTGALMVDTLKAKGCAVVICLSHLGLAYDRLLASYVPGIDLIVGGHDHFRLSSPAPAVNPLGDTTWIVQAESYYLAGGKARLRVSGGKARLLDYAYLPVTSAIPAEPTVSATVDFLVAGVEATYGPMYTTRAGYVKSFFAETIDSLKSRGPKDTPIGNLVADTWRSVLRTQIGVQACGSTAHPLYPGPITGADVFRVNGYGYNLTNGLGFYLARFTLSGLALEMGLEFGVSDLEGADDFLLQVSGVRYKYDPARKPYDRVYDITVGGLPLQPFGAYTIAANEFTVLFLQSTGIPFSDLHICTGDTTEFQTLMGVVMATDTLKPYTDGRVMADFAVDVETLAEMPDRFELSQNYPNPFNPSTLISYRLPAAASIRLAVYDMLGREVSLLVNEPQSAGAYQVRFDGSGLASGVYLYRIQAGEYTQSRKLMLLR